MQLQDSNGDFYVSLAILCRRVSAAIVAVSTLRLAMLAFGAPYNEAYQALLIIVALLALMLFGDRGQRPLQTSSRMTNAATTVFWLWIALVAVLLVLGYVTKTTSIYSRKLLMTWALITPVVILLAHLFIDGIIRRLTLSGTNKRKVVIAGANEHGQLLATKIRQSGELGMSVVGLFDDRGEERLGNIGKNNLLGRLHELPDYVRENGIDLIYIALPIRNIQRVTELLDNLHDTTASIYYVPDVFVFDLIQCRTDEIDGLPIVALCETPFYGSRGLIKRISDYLIAVTVLAVLSPLMLTIAIAVKSTTPGSVIFRQRRYGIDGREINIYKFRTMYVSEDADNVRQATRNDNRVTPIGAYLRKYSLDELPQFFNVLQGNMSVVGPRPHAVAHNEQYRKLIKGYMIRHKVNPGLTGLAQIRGFRGETETVEAMQQRVEADLEYLRNWSLGLDIKIVFRTVAVMFSDTKAY